MAAKLRDVSSSLADEDPERRRAFVEDELKRGLEEATSGPGASRDGFLAALEAHFPVFDGAEHRVPVAPPAERAEGPPSRRERPVEAICNNPSALTPEEWERLRLLLEERGMMEPAPPVVAAPAEAIPPELAAVLDCSLSEQDVQECLRGIRRIWEVAGGGEESPDDKIVFYRLVKLLGIMIPLVEAFRATIWSFWDSFASRDLRRLYSPELEGSFGAVAGDYIAGREGTSSSRLSADLKKTGGLLGALIPAIEQVASAFGRDFESKFSPTSIEETVAMKEDASDARKVKKLDEKCWQEYRELARKRMAALALEQRFREIFARSLEGAMRANQARESQG